MGIVASLALLCGAPAAVADWNGDGKADVLAIDANGQLLLYPGTGAGKFAPNGGQIIGSGWGAFTALLATEWSGDGRTDLIARTSDGLLTMYRGNGKGGFVTGTGESLGGGWAGFTALVAPGDFSGDGHPDILAVQSDGVLLLYRGNGDSGFSGAAQTVGGGWQAFSPILGPGDFSGDGNVDLLARSSDALLLFRGNGAAGWVTGSGETVGGGWAAHTALAAGGDFSGDGLPDVLVRTAGGALHLYRGNGTGGWASVGDPVGAGWQTLTSITLVGEPRKPPAAPPGPPSPPPPPPGDGRVRLTAGDHCVPPGGRLHVSLKIKKRKGKKRPRVAKVVFFVRNGPRRVDRTRPYSARLPLRRPAGTKGRVYARVFFRRAGTKKLRRKTVARRYVMCS